MSSTEALLGALVSACARAGVDRSLAASSAIGARHFQAAQGLIAERLDADRRDAVASSVRAMSPGDLAWRPEVGLARSMALTDPVLASMQLAVASTGRGRIRANTADAVLFVSGQGVRVGGDVTVKWSDTELHVCSEAVRATYTRTPGGWNETTKRSAGVFDEGFAGAALYLMDAREVAAHTEFPDIGLLPQLDVGTIPETIDSIRAALHLLQTYAPPYAHWIANVVRGLLLTEAAETGLGTVLHPGLVSIPVGLDPVGYAEVLVVAAAQQYRHQLSTVVPLLEGDAEQIRYLPHRRSYTTTRRALAAAHGHSNVLALLELLQRAPALENHCIRQVALRQLALRLECEPLLHGAEVLTAYGRAMWNYMRRPITEDTPREAVTQ